MTESHTYLLDTLPPGTEILEARPTRFRARLPDGELRTYSIGFENGMLRVQMDAVTVGSDFAVTLGVGSR